MDVLDRIYEIRFIGTMWIKTGFHQWVACPETGEMVITFANGEYSAENEQTEIHYFNFYDLLNGEQ